MPGGELGRKTEQDEVGSDRPWWRMVVTLHRVVRDSLGERGVSHTGIWRLRMLQAWGPLGGGMLGVFKEQQRSHGVWTRMSEGENE